MSFREGYCSVFRMTAEGTIRSISRRRTLQIQRIGVQQNPRLVDPCRKSSLCLSGQSTAGLSQLFVMNVDGTDIRQLTETGTNGSPRARQRAERDRDFDREDDDDSTP